ncbi:MAG: transglutaminase-like domain-containing protein [Flavobacteriales bacterium]
MSNKSLLLFLLLCICTPVLAQQKIAPQVEFDRVKAKYSDVSIVCLSKSERSSVEYIKGELKVVSQVSRENMFLDENGSFYNTAVVPSSHFFQADGIDARSLVPNGKSYKAVKAGVAEKSDHMSGSIFHDDLVLYNVSFPDASKGSKSILKYREVITEPHFFGNYYFDAPGMPTENSRFEVILPTGFELAYAYYNLDSTKLSYTVTTMKTGKVQHVWEMRDIPETKRESRAPGYKHLSPHVVVYLKSITTKSGKRENYLSDYKDLHRWYYDFVRNVNKQGSSSLDSLSIAITKEARTEKEKIQNVFYWVQDNIKYIAFEDGLGGFVPRNAKDIYEKRYGDCKDMTSIMHYMLKQAGVPTYMTWIGTRELPYSYLSLPTPFNDNHMILAWQDGDNWSFIDGTSSFNEMGMPSSFIQGKEAMIHIDSTKCIIANVPVVDPQKNSVADTLEVTMLKGVLFGRGAAWYDGYYKQSLNRNITSMTKEETWKYCTALLEKGNNKFALDSLFIQNKGNRELPLVVNYKFNVRDYVYLNGDEAYVNLHLDKDYLDDYLDSKRKTPLDQNFTFQHNWHYKFYIPEGYSVIRIPENVLVEYDLFSFRLNYSLKGNRIESDFQYTNKFMMLGLERFTDWNTMMTKLNAAFKQTIVLKQIATSK